MRKISSAYGSTGDRGISVYEILDGMSTDLYVIRFSRVSVGSRVTLGPTFEINETF